MIYSKWDLRLTGQPDNAFMVYLLEGLKQGFRIGFDMKMPSRQQHEQPRAVADLGGGGS